MNLKEVVAITGKPGLYKVIGRSKSGFSLESLGEPNARIVVNGNTRIAYLNEITVYDAVNEEGLRLESILKKIDANPTIIPDRKASNDLLKKYFLEIEPTHNTDKVYPSDIRKLISWYQILSKLPLWDESPEKEDLSTEQEAFQKTDQKEEAPSDTLSVNKAKPKGAKIGKIKTEKETKIKTVSKKNDKRDINTPPTSKSKSTTTKTHKKSP